MGAHEGQAPGAPSSLGRLLAEFKRRRVFRVLVGYGLFAFAMLQVAEPLMHGLHLPDWVLTALIAALAAGFPVAVVLAWVFDLTVDGVKRTPAAPGSISLSRGRLATLLVGVGLVAALPGLGWFLLRPAGQAAPVAPPSASGTSVPAAPTTPSVAVLPFTDLSPQHDQEYFADGMAEEILNALAQVEGLRVAGRTSAFAFKGKAEDLVAIAQKLRVGSILEGSVRMAGKRVRITAQLINAADGFHLWSQTFERELTGVFAIQDEIARAVTSALKVKLLSERTGPARRQETDPEAYRLYLLGRQLQVQGTVAALDRAIEALRRAARLAPGDARIQSQLVSVIWSRWTLGEELDVHASPELGAWWRELFGDNPTTEQVNKVVREMADRAVALGPELPEVYVTRGLIRNMTGWDWAEALADDEKALSLAPGDVQARTIYARLLASTGKVSESLAVMLKVVEDDPLLPGAWLWMGAMQDAAGQPALGEAALRRGLELAPNGAYLQRELAFSLMQQGRAAEALAIGERHPITWIRLLLTAMAHHQLGQVEASKLAMTQLEGGSDDWSYQMAQASAWRGEKERALGHLERAYRINDPGLRFTSFDPAFKSLRGEPRFRALLRKMNLPGG
jgi:TolB-like protein/Tfp pilus assembly protein PilF